MTSAPALTRTKSTKIPLVEPHLLFFPNPPLHNIAISHIPGVSLSLSGLEDLSYNVEDCHIVRNSQNSPIVTWEETEVITTAAYP
jgi:hypothetical protein